jgi:hypothetical protein
LLDHSPASSEALEAATWILLNTPDGPEVKKAGQVVLQEHIQDPGLAELCQKLERLRHRCATNLLEAILSQNPDPEVKANACFYLATLWKQAASFGQNKKATAQAATLFERVIAEFGRVGQTGVELARKAKPELYELPSDHREAGTRNRRRRSRWPEVKRGRLSRSGRGVFLLVL